MKRKFFVALSLFALVLAMAVPAMAVDYREDTLHHDGQIHSNYYFPGTGYLFGSTTGTGSLYFEGSGSFNPVFTIGTFPASLVSDNATLATLAVKLSLWADPGANLQVKYRLLFRDSDGRDITEYTFTDHPYVPVGGRDIEHSFDLRNMPNGTGSVIVFVTFTGLISGEVEVTSYTANLQVSAPDPDRYVPGGTTPGGDVVDEWKDTEEGLQNSTQDGKDAWDDLQLSVTDIVLTYGTSLLAVSYILDAFLEVLFVKNLLATSLALGSFALLLGLIISLGRRR